MPLEILQNGRYRILRQLGSGSMGEVYLVEDTRINRQVAIKVIRTETASYSDSNTTSDAARLFEREARAVAKLNHPNILPLFDFGEEVVNGAPLTYMVMPYCQEGSLATWLQQRGEGNLLSSADVAHFLHQAADALQHAHDNDIIHQDVKPQNFLIRSNRNAHLPDLLLADFGIAKLTAGTSGASQAIRGTPIYMAPEQWEGHPVPASDQYALAIMIYQLLTGRPPFQGGPGQMMYQHFSVAPQPPSAFNPSLTHDVDSILLHALAKRPQNRFVSVSAFGKALQEALLIDVPTIMNTQSKSAADTIHATLAISYAEAINGTSRTLTLTGGRRIRVEIPAGIQNGQVIQVFGQDSFSDNRGATIPLLLTIAIAPTAVNYPPVFPAGEPGATYSKTDGSRTNMSNNPPVYNTVPPLFPGGDNATISNNPTIVQGAARPTPIPQPYYNEAYYNNGGSALPPQNNQAKPPRRRRTGLTLFIIGLVLLLLIGSAGFVIFSFASSSASNNASATATTQANNDTATSQNGATSTALSNANALATSTATGATATADSQGKTNATATASANQANATETAVAQGYANATATALATTPTPTPTPFSVVSVTIAVNPTSIAGMTCGSAVTVTYTATFVVTSNSPGGTVKFDYTINNGQSNTTANLTFAAKQTTKKYQFSWSGNLPADHTYPGVGEIITSSPNQITSNGIQPSGQCT